MKLLYLIFAFLAYSCKADYNLNITIDDTNTTAIQYTPPNGWQVLETGQDLNNGSIQWYNLEGGSVAFKFTGIAVYFLSPLWPKQIGMYASVDGSPAGYINVTDPNAVTNISSPRTTPSHPVWSSTGLDNKPHVLVLGDAISMGGWHDLNVDGFIYTAVVADVSISSSSTSQTTSASATSTSSRSQNVSPHSQAITGSIIGAVLGALVVLVVAWLLHRRILARHSQSRILHGGDNALIVPWTPESYQQMSQTGERPAYFHANNTTASSAPLSGTPHSAPPARLARLRDSSRTVRSNMSPSECDGTDPPPSYDHHDLIVGRGHEGTIRHGKIALPNRTRILT